MENKQENDLLHGIDVIYPDYKFEETDLYREHLNDVAVHNQRIKDGQFVVVYKHPHLGFRVCDSQESAAREACRNWEYVDCIIDGDGDVFVAEDDQLFLLTNI